MRIEDTVLLKLVIADPRHPQPPRDSAPWQRWARPLRVSRAASKA